MLLIGRVLSSQYLKGGPILALNAESKYSLAHAFIASSRVAFGWVR